MNILTTTSRCRNPLLTRVEDFENSPEWLKLTCSINDLKNNRVDVTSKLLPKNLPQPEDWAREFEKSYFHQPQESQLMSTAIISKKNSQIPLTRNDKDAKKTSEEFTCKDETLGKSDILFRPGSMEFRGSRERLHEIFEHNRLLRKRFFELNDFNALETASGLISKDKHSGFGSTETLESQSNQSAGSSMNGKSRDFENSPDLDDSNAFANGEIVKNTLLDETQRNFQCNQAFSSQSCNNSGSGEGFESFQGQSTVVTTSEIAETMTKENCGYKQNGGGCKLQEFCLERTDGYDFVNEVLKREERGTCEIGDTLKSPQLVSNFSNSMMDLNGEFGKIERSHLYDTLGSDAERRKSIGSSTPGNGSTLPFVYGPIPYSQYFRVSLLQLWR